MKQLNRLLLVISVGICAVISGYMFLTRFAHLHNGFQYDELYSIATASPTVPWKVIWHDMLLTDVNLPLFNVLFYGWNHLFPIIPLYAHLFSALIGALAVIAAALLVPPGWPKLKRFFLVVLMACSFILVMYGSNVRSYSLSVLCATCFSLLALRLVACFEQDKNPSAGLWTAFFISGLLGSYSHYFCSALFFITALVVFLYACYYRRGRACSFWGTAAIFAIWLLWAGRVIWNMQGGSAGPSHAATWWYDTPFMLAIWKAFLFLFGYPPIQLGILFFIIIGGVSLIFQFHGRLLKQVDIMLPLAQIVLLCAVLSVVGMRFNLWMDRYFLPLLPGIFILLASVLYHLQQRHRIFILCLPALCISWMLVYWQSEYTRQAEYTGWPEAFAYLTGPHGSSKVLIKPTRDYAKAALRVMLQYYVPKGATLEPIWLTKETAPLSWQENPRVPILVVLCSQVHLMHVMGEAKVEPAEKPIVFGGDTCIFLGKPVVKANDNGKK